MNSTCPPEYPGELEKPNWHERQRAVALECFRIVNGLGDAGSEAEFNCRRITEQSGWLRLAAEILEWRKQ